MPALDTNVLVRYLVADDRNQFEIAKNLIDTSDQDVKFLIPISVSIELEWVLRSLYEFTKPTILDTYTGLLEAREIQFQEESSIEIALNLYTEHNTDFSDCLHIAIAYSNEAEPLLTFDRKASRVPGASIIE